jgi:hypothetical protein
MRLPIWTQTPGSNAVNVTERVRETMSITLATRFPIDLAYTVFFDTTVFVTATINEVIRTGHAAIPQRRKQDIRRDRPSALARGIMSL